MVSISVETQCEAISGLEISWLDSTKISLQKTCCSFRGKWHCNLRLCKQLFFDMIHHTTLAKRQDTVTAFEAFEATFLDINPEGKGTSFILSNSDALLHLEHRRGSRETLEW